MILDKFIVQIKAQAQGFAKAMKGASGLKAQMSALAGASAGAGVALAGALALITERSTAAADSIAKSAAAVGITTDALQAYRFAAERSGIAATEIDTALAKLNRRLAEGREGIGEATIAFDKLGISAKELQGLSLEDSLLRISEGFQNLEDPQEQTLVAMKLFEEAGAKFIPLLAKQEGGLADLAREFQDLGLAIDEGFIERSEEYRDQLLVLQKAKDKLFSVIADTVLPTMMSFAKATTDIIAGLARWLDETKQLETAIPAAFIALTAVTVGFGAVSLATAGSVIAAWAAALWPVLAAAAAFLYLFLIVEDFLTYLDGGDSIIGRVIDSVSAWIEENQTLAAVIHGLLMVMNPLVALATLIYTVFTLIKDPISDLIAKYSELWDSSKSLTENMKTIFTAMGKDILQVFANIIRKVTELPGKAKEAFRNAVRGAGEFLGLGGGGGAAVADSSAAGQAAAGGTTVSNNTNNSNSQSINVTVNGDADPEKFRQVVREELSTEMLSAATGTTARFN